MDSDAGSTAAVTSTVYKWDNLTSSFILPTSVDVDHATDVQRFHVDGRSFLVFTTRKNNFVTDEEVIKIYQVITAKNSGTLPSYQSILFVKDYQSVV